MTRHLVLTSGFLIILAHCVVVVLTFVFVIIVTQRVNHIVVIADLLLRERPERFRPMDAEAADLEIDDDVDDDDDEETNPDDAVKNDFRYVVE